MASKADYVRRAPPDGRHVCHWPGCPVRVPPAMWGCRHHWFKLPTGLRAKIWRSYRAGQEIDKRPSREYILAAQEVQAWIAAQRPAREPGPLFDERR